jgi:hypothetical protein
MERLLHLLLRGARPTKGHGKMLAVLLSALVWHPIVIASPSADAALEYRIKSAYLFNFTKFVDWPPVAFAAADARFTIGVLTGDAGAPTGLAIANALNGKLSGPRVIEVRLFEHASPDLQACHLVFVTRAARQELAAVRAALATRPILLVGESEGFAQHGGTINLAVTGDTVRCEINLRQAERTGLKLSGRLASVARLVREEGVP